MSLKASEQEYRESLAYLRAKLSEPDVEVEHWLNNIVDGWIANRRATKAKKRHG